MTFWNFSPPCFNTFLKLVFLTRRSLSVIEWFLPNGGIERLLFKAGVEGDPRPSLGWAWSSSVPDCVRSRDESNVRTDDVPLMHDSIAFAIAYNHIYHQRILHGDLP
jgi:hypothetical protein